MVGEPIPYSEFRTGLTYHDVYMMIYSRRWKRRRGVLGFWHELKQRMYAEYLFQLHEASQCTPKTDSAASATTATDPS